jgi:hypothetical protein
MANGKSFGARSLSGILRISARLRFLFGLVLVFAGVPAYAYIWNGAAGDGRWTNPENWGGGGYPQSQSDTAEFNESATVTLDANGSLAVGIIKVAAGKTVTVNGTAGASLNPYKPAAVDGNGFVVGANGCLVLNVPVVSSGRIDKWQSGEVVFNADVTISGDNFLLVDCGVFRETVFPS